MDEPSQMLTRQADGMGICSINILPYKSGSGMETNSKVCILQVSFTAGPKLMSLAGLHRERSTSFGNVACIRSPP